MLVGVQWTLAQPQDWTWLDVSPTVPQSRLWSKLPKKPVPAGGETIDNQPGWIFDVVIQGVTLYGSDHYALEPISGGGVRAYKWSDDLDDVGTDYRWGEVWEFHAPRPDPRFGGQTNTFQVKTVYAEDLADMGKLFPQESSAGPVALRPWSEFPMPPDAATFHGIWVPSDGTDSLWARHYAARRQVDWREWVD